MACQIECHRLFWSPICHHHRYAWCQRTIHRWCRRCRWCCRHNHYHRLLQRLAWFSDYSQRLTSIFTWLFSLSLFLRYTHTVKSQMFPLSYYTRLFLNLDFFALLVFLYFWLFSIVSEFSTNFHTSHYNCFYFISFFFSLLPVLRCLFAMLTHFLTTHIYLDKTKSKIKKFIHIHNENECIVYLEAHLNRVKSWELIKKMQAKDLLLFLLWWFLLLLFKMWRR